MSVVTTCKNSLNFIGSHCILDDYSVHITNEVKKALLAKGHILVVIGGGITGDVRCNYTHIHHKLKKVYREIEAKKMIEMLRENPNKIPSPTRDDVMIMLASAWNSLDLDVNEALKQNFITTPLFDGTGITSLEIIYFHWSIPK